MGNCQAIDAATLAVEHPSGKVEKLYWPVAASEIMKMNPGFYVALLITTTVCHTTTTQNNMSNNHNITHKSHHQANHPHESGRNTVRVTRIKLLRPTDTLALGHVYRLITTQEVMKGLMAKKRAKMRKNGIELADSEGLREAEKLVRRSQQDKTHQVSRHGHRSGTTSAGNGGTAKPKTWQPSLNSISEAAS